MAKTNKSPSPKKPTKVKTNPLANIKNRTATATRSLSDIDREREDQEKAEAQKPTTISLEEIKPRPGDDTRPLHPEHIVSLAESISTLGLLEPLVLDREGHLLAGGHRLAALKLLNAEPQNRIDVLKELCHNLSDKDEEPLGLRMSAMEWTVEGDMPDTVPVHILDFDSTQDMERALAIEAAENTQRRDYTSKEVFALYHRLLEAGYTDRRGKPQSGEKPARPALATVIGKSVKTVERMLKKANENGQQDEDSQAEELQRALGLLEKAIARVLHCSEKYEVPAEFEELALELQKKRTGSLIQNVRKALGWS